MDPATISLLASTASGFLGGQGPELPPEMKRLYQFLLNLARDRKRYAKGVPLSDPQEQAALAQSKALAGEGIGQQYEGLLAALGTDNPNAADALQRFRSGAAGTMAGIDAGALLASLQNRQAALGQAAEFASRAQGPGSAYGPQQSGGFDLGGAFSQWAQMEAMNSAQKQQQKQFEALMAQNKPATFTGVQQPWPSRSTRGYYYGVDYNRDNGLPDSDWRLT